MIEVNLKNYGYYKTGQKISNLSIQQNKEDGLTIK